MLGSLLAKLKGESGPKSGHPDHHNGNDHGSRPVIIPRKVLESDNPFVVVEFVGHFLRILATKQKYDVDDLPPVGTAFFEAGRFVYLISEGSLALYLKKNGPQTLIWTRMGPTITFLRQAGLRAHANLLELLTQWVLEHPATDPAQALESGEEDLVKLQSLADQMLRHMPREQAGHALIQALRMLPELLVMEAADDVEYLSIVNEFYPVQEKADFQTALRSIIRRQFLDTGYVATSLLTFSIKEVSPDMEYFGSGSPADTNETQSYYLVKTNAGRRFLIIGNKKARLHEAIPDDLSYLYTEPSLSLREQERLKKAVENIRRSGGALTIGRVLAEMDRELLEACIRLAERIEAWEALFQLVLHHFGPVRHVIVLWNWSIETTALARNISNSARHRGGVWQAVVTDMNERHHLVTLYIEGDIAVLMDEANRVIEKIKRSLLPSG